MRINKILWPLTALVVGLNSPLSAAKSSDDSDETLVVEATAEQVLKQQPGVSIITSEDIKRTLRSTTSPILFAKCRGEPHRQQRVRHPR